jgi:uncharacterized protein YsxB (DUF464 family)
MKIKSQINECKKINCIACGQKYDKIEFAQHIENCQKRTIYSFKNEIYFRYEVKDIYEKYFKKIFLNHKTLINNLKNLSL